MKPALIGLAFTLIAARATAGDIAAGANIFGKCKACHAITAPDGTVIRKGGKIGPDLYGVIGRQIGAFPGYNYSAAAVAAGSDGTRWDEPMITAWLTDPSAWLQQKTGDGAAKSKMAYSLTIGGADVATYLASVAPPAN